MWCYVLGFLYMLYCVFIIKFFRNLIFKTLKFTEVIPKDLPEKYLPFVRYDRHNWRIWEIYFGAVTIFPIRLIMALSFVIIGYLFAKIMSFGQKFEEPYSPMRNKITKSIFSFLNLLFLIAQGFLSIKVKKVQYRDFDPDYVQSEEDRKRLPSIIVSNHVTWFDTEFYMWRFHAAFLSKEDVVDYPFVGIIAKHMRCIFVRRTQQNLREQTRLDIKQRVQNIEKGESYTPIVIFPEGTTSNSRYLLSFKKGAFEPLTPIKICCLKYQDRHFNLAYDNLDFASLIIGYTQLYNAVTLYEFEGLYNPSHLFKGHEKEEEKWHIFSEKVRDIMASCLGVQKSDSGYRETMEYHNSLFPWKLTNKKKD